MQFIIFIGFTLVVALVSYFATRNTNESTSDGYFLGGRSLKGGVIAGSLLLTNLSTEQIVGLNGVAFKDGLLVMAWEVLAALAMVITALYLLPRYLKQGLTTIPQFLEKRFDKRTKIYVSFLFLTGYVIVLLPTVLYSGALAINSMFNVSEILRVSDTKALWITVWTIGVLGSVYAIFGGLKAVAVSDSVNAIGLLIGGFFIPYFGLKLIGNGSFFEGMHLLFKAHPDKFKSLGTKDSSIPFETLFTGMMLVQLFYWGTNQAIIQRALGAKNLKEGQKGLLIAAVFKIIGPLILVVPGIIAYHLFGNTIVNSDEAYPRLVTHVLPVSLLGFFAAVLFGAILSSYNSALNSSVTLFSLDIYKELINKEATEKEMVKNGKKFGILVSILSMLIAPMLLYASKGVFGYLQEVNGIYSIPILSVIVMGYISKKVTAFSAKTVLIIGSLLYVLSQFIMKPFLFGNESYPHFLHVMAILFLINIGLMQLFSIKSKEKNAFTTTKTEILDIIPLPNIKWYAIVIGVVVLVIYLYFL